MAGAATAMTWVLESGVFPKSHAPLREAVELAGHTLVDWDDEWWDAKAWAAMESGPVLFHGSLQNAARLHAAQRWTPGAYCDVAGFRCSAWYERAAPWLLNARWQVLPAAELVSDPDRALDAIGCGDTVFVRPDDPTKPFSGRVLPRELVTLAALDHGFYFDDAQLPVLIAPAVEVGREWRFVVVDRQVVAGSGYAVVSRGRAGVPGDATGAPWRFAQEIATAVELPEPVFAMDVCELGGDLRLLELNPFSGADLYACDARPIVAAIAAYL